MPRKAPVDEGPRRLNRTPDLSVRLGSLRMRNPITTASGTFGVPERIDQIYPLGRLGALTLKSVTPLPRPGNPMPRIAEVPSGILNSIGLENPGIDAFLEKDLPEAARYGVPIIVSVAGYSVDDYARLCERLGQRPEVSALELNLSCPNAGREIMELGMDPELAHRVVATARSVTDLPLIPKLTPQAADCAAVAKACEEAGADAVAAINTVQAMAIDIHARVPKVRMGICGLSGPAVRPIAVRIVWQVYEAVSIPILAMGGAMTGEDVVEFMLAGATAVAIGTGAFVDYHAPEKAVAGLREYLESNGFAAARDIIGLAHREAERLAADPDAPEVLHY